MIRFENKVVINCKCNITVIFVAWKEFSMKFISFKILVIKLHFICTII